MSEGKKERVRAYVVCGTPPDTVQTVAEWLEWRRQEDARMALEVGKQVVASMELNDGATVH